LKREILTVWKGKFWHFEKENLTVWKGKFWQFGKGNFDSLKTEILTIWKENNFDSLDFGFGSRLFWGDGASFWGWKNSWVSITDFLSFEPPGVP
jgi:hypothetical protein